jgi:hypothetical protein
VLNRQCTHSRRIGNGKSASVYRSVGSAKRGIWLTLICGNIPSSVALDPRRLSHLYASTYTSLVAPTPIHLSPQAHRDLSWAFEQLTNPTSQQKTGVKPPNLLTHYKTTTSTCPMSFPQPAILDIELKKTKPRPPAGANSFRKTILAVTPLL